MTMHLGRGRSWSGSKMAGIALALGAVVLLGVPARRAMAQSTVPAFQHTFGSHPMTMLGREPAQGGTTTIPVVLVSLRLTFAGTRTGAKSPFVLDAAPDIASIEHSPIFAAYDFPSGGHTQFVDAMLRTTFPAAANWHTLLGHPRVEKLSLTVPASEGYVLASKRTGGAIAIADISFLQKAVFQHVPAQTGALVLVISPNTSFYGGAGGCCTFGTHGVDASTGNTFVLASYLDHPPGIITGRDVQPITAALAGLVNDPHANPLFRGRGKSPGNNVAAWRIPGQARACGRGLWAEPTNTAPHDDFPDSAAYAARLGASVYHLDNVALVNWYTGTPSTSYSFPAQNALRQPAQPCPAFRFRGPSATPPPAPSAAALPESSGTHGHALIGYWIGYSSARQTFPLEKISPQWDIVIVAFAQPDHTRPEGTFKFAPPSGMSAADFKAGVAALQKAGKKVMVSLGGGGQDVSLDSPASVATFEKSVGQIVADYGFDGVDIDFEAPSMELQAGDTDFRHPTTPSIVHLLTALRGLHQRFGSSFMISLVPEGPQIPGGLPTYGGQYGSYLPLAYGLHDMLSFIDVQNYNTFPDEGLDGNIYQLGSMDYYTSMTELLLKGFDAGGNPAYHFPALPASKVAIGFITGEPVDQIRAAMSYLTTGQKPAEAKYTLQNPAGYPALLGAMLWTINGDRMGNYDFSNVIGPELHGFKAGNGASQTALSR